MILLSFAVVCADLENFNLTGGMKLFVGQRNKGSFVDFVATHQLFRVHDGAFNFSSLDIGSGWKLSRRFIIVINTGAWFNQLKFSELGKFFFFFVFFFQFLVLRRRVDSFT